MPKELEDKLKKHYGADSDIPYKIMNRLGLLRNSKKKKHDLNIKGEMDKEKEVEAIKNKTFKKQYFMSSAHHAHGDAKPIKNSDLASKFMKLKRG